MQLFTPDNFHYLNQSQCYTVDGIDDVKEFADTRVRHPTAQLRNHIHNIFHYRMP